MKLYLVQHGNQNSEEIDPEEGLSDKGRRDCEKVAAFAGNSGIKVDFIYHSVKLRAKQTAEIFANHLGSTTQEMEGLKPMDDVSMWKEKLKDNLMLVGHMPFMQKLTSLLITGDEEKLIYNFQQGGIVCLEKDENEKWAIRFAVNPELL